MVMLDGDSTISTEALECLFCLDCVDGACCFLNMDIVQIRKMVDKNRCDFVATGSELACCLADESGKARDELINGDRIPGGLSFLD